MRVLIAAAATGLTLSAVAVLAHDMYRVDGTITKVDAIHLDVKGKGGAIVSFAVDMETRVLSGEKAVPLSRLKNGSRVIVDGYGDPGEPPLAVIVRIAPATTHAPAK